MDFFGVKLFLALCFFACLLWMARWAVNKIDEYFDE